MALETNLPPSPGDDRRGRGCLASPVFVLLLLHLWLGPMPVLWASTSNNLMSYMLQPTGWSGHSSLPAILHTVQPKLIFNTEAKHVKGLKCENVYVCVWRGEVFVAEQLTFFERIHRSSHFCLLDARLEFFFLKKRRQRERKRSLAYLKCPFFWIPVKKEEEEKNTPQPILRGLSKVHYICFPRSPSSLTISGNTVHAFPKGKPIGGSTLGTVYSCNSPSPPYILCGVWS